MASGLRFTNTYNIHTPGWHVRAFAEGYETSERIDLCDGYTEKAERGAERNRLEVPIALHKAK